MRISSAQDTGLFGDNVNVTVAEGSNQPDVLCIGSNNSLAAVQTARNDHGAGWYYNGQRITSGFQGFTITTTMHSDPVRFEERLEWPMHATRDLDGMYTCVVGNNQSAVMVNIERKCSGFT